MVMVCLAEPSTSNGVKKSSKKQTAKSGMFLYDLVEVGRGEMSFKNVVNSYKYSIHLALTCRLFPNSCYFVLLRAITQIALIS